MNIDVSNIKTILDSEYKLTILSNASSYLFLNIDDINWCGFYILQDERLILGPFQGKPACDIIPISKGVCGFCARKKETVVVKNVHDFDGHIACDSESNSEIVIPIFVNNSLYGLLDIDSKKFDRFSIEDKVVLEKFVKEIEPLLENAKTISGLI